jgi:hypothetical protein
VVTSETYYRAMTADDPQAHGDRRVEELGHQDGPVIEGRVVQLDHCPLAFTQHFGILQEKG